MDSDNEPHVGDTDPSSDIDSEDSRHDAKDSDGMAPSARKRLKRSRGGDSDSSYNEEDDDDDEEIYSDNDKDSDYEDTNSSHSRKKSPMLSVFEETTNINLSTLNRDMDGLSQYERKRLNRIHSNRAEFDRLGVSELSDMPHARQYAHRRQKVAAEPTRHSARLTHAPTSYVELPDDYRERVARSSHSRWSSVRGSDGSFGSFTPGVEKYTMEQYRTLGTCKKEYNWSARMPKRYDSVSGVTCHQCRQKTIDPKTTCTVCHSLRGSFCGMCLQIRYGENLDEVREKVRNGIGWTCPSCRGFCNCSFCRAKRGLGPTGIMYPKIEGKAKSVAHYLLHRFLVDENGNYVNLNKYDSQGNYNPNLEEEGDGDSDAKEDENENDMNGDNAKEDDFDDNDATKENINGDKMKDTVKPDDYDNDCVNKPIRESENGSVYEGVSENGYENNLEGIYEDSHGSNYNNGYGNGLENSCESNYEGKYMNKTADMKYEYVRDNDDIDDEDEDENEEEEEINRMSDNENEFIEIEKVDEDKEVEKVDFDGGNNSVAKRRNELEYHQMPVNDTTNWQEIESSIVMKAISNDYKNFRDDDDDGDSSADERLSSYSNGSFNSQYSRSKKDTKSKKKGAQKKGKRKRSRDPEDDLIDIVMEKDSVNDGNDIGDPNDPQPHKRGRKKGKKVGPYKKRASGEETQSKGTKKMSAEIEIDNGSNSSDDAADATDGSNGSNSSSDSDEDRGEDVYDVESILDEAVEDGVKYYQVKWAGYDEVTWEPEENCVGCERKIKEFHERKKNSAKNRRKSRSKR